MADISKIGTRRNAQDRITENRDSVLPSRRETRTPDVQVRADMRSAARGDGGLDELRDFFNGLQRGAETYFEYETQKIAEDARGEYADGTVDAAAGREMDPERAKAYAYRRGFTSVEAANRQTAFERETQQEADAMINRGATVEEIETYQTQRVQEFIGATADTYDTDEVRYEVAERLTRWGTAEDNRIGGAIKEKTDREFLDLTVAETQARLERGEPVDLAADRARLEDAGLNGVVVQEALVKGIAAYAMETGDLSGVYAALDARSAEDVALEVEEARNAPDIEGSELPPVAEAAPVAAPAPTVETYRAPVEGRETSGYGQRRAPIPGASTNHRAVDIAVPVGTEVGAPASGVIEFAGTRGNAGKMMIIRHADGSSTEFMHLSGFNAEQGATVTQGQIVARSGNTGNSSGPHLHWASKDADGNPRDPRNLVGQEIAGTAAPAAGDVAADVTAQTAERRDRRPGRSILTTEQQVYLLGVVEQVEADTERNVEKDRQDKRDALATELFEASLNGTNVDDRITAAMRDGTLNASEAMSYRNAFTSLRNDQAEGEADEDVVLNYAERFATPSPNWTAISAQADRDYQAGRFGNGRAATRAYLDIKQRAANGNRGDNAIPVEERRTATIARGYVSSSLGSLFPAGVEPSPTQRRLIADAQIEWERRVAAGESPMTVADAVYADYSGRIRNSGRPQPAPGAPGAGGGRQPGQTQTTQQTPRRTAYDSRGNAIGD